MIQTDGKTISYGDAVQPEIQPAANALKKLDAIAFSYFIIK